MDNSIFKKMKLKRAFSARVLFAHENYPVSDEFTWVDAGQADFVHLFVESREQFNRRFSQAIEASNENGMIWISYPKSKGKKKYERLCG